MLFPTFDFFKNMLLSALDFNLLTPIFFVTLYYNGSPYIFSNINSEFTFENF